MEYIFYGIWMNPLKSRQHHECSAHSSTWETSIRLNFFCMWCAIGSAVIFFFNKRKNAYNTRTEWWVLFFISMLSRVALPFVTILVKLLEAFRELFWKIHSQWWTVRNFIVRPNWGCDSFDILIATTTKKTTHHSNGHCSYSAHHVWISTSSKPDKLCLAFDVI